jgi:hypothetical protein
MDYDNIKYKDTKRTKNKKNKKNIYSSKHIRIQIENQNKVKIEIKSTNK